MNRAIGEAQRAKLRRVVASKLFVGARIPNCETLAKLLGISPSQAGMHMRLVLAEDGIVTERRGIGSRLHVIALPNKPGRE